MKRIFPFAFALVVVFFSSGCEEGPITPWTQPGGWQNGGPTFDLDQFEDNLQTWLSVGEGGWSYAIVQDGQLVRDGGIGSARNATDGSVSMTPNTEMNLASVTKFFTAIAAMQLIDRLNINLDSDIEPYLPDSWPQGPGVNNLTFRDLLTHRSGLQSTNNNFSQTLSYRGLQAAIATGVVNPKTRNYLNVNFALFRVLIPKMWRTLPGAPAIPVNVNDAQSQQFYDDYMQQFVFGPAGVSLGLQPSGGNQETRYYNINDNGQAGISYGDWAPISGGGGYYGSAMEVAAILAFFWESESLVTNATRTLMRNNRIGFDLANGSLEEHGPYFGKGGSISNGSGQGVRLQTAHFGNGIDVIVMENRQGGQYPVGSGTSLQQTIHISYNEAWD